MGINMTYNEDEQIYTMASGKTIDANNGILGIAPGDPSLYEGYDSTPWMSYEKRPVELRREVAEFMIKQWKLWAEMEPTE